MRSGSSTAAASASEARSSVSAGRSRTSDDDINPSLALDDIVAFQPQAWIGRAFARLQLVFPAMPGADDVRLVMIVGLAEERLVRTEHIEDLAPDDTLAGRAALMQAIIPVSVIGAIMSIDADFEFILVNNADIAVLHLDVLTYENLLRHPSRAPCCLDHDVKTVL